LSNIAGKIKVLIPSKIVLSALIEPLFAESKLRSHTGLTGFADFWKFDAATGASAMEILAVSGFSGHEDHHTSHFC